MGRYFIPKNRADVLDSLDQLIKDTATTWDPHTTPEMLTYIKKWVVKNTEPEGLTSDDSVATDTTTED